MSKYEIIGGYTVIHYHCKVYEANSREEAINMAKSDLEEQHYCFYEWEVNDIKEVDDFDILEIGRI